MVAEQPRPPAGLRPAAIAVHDDGHVARDVAEGRLDPEKVDEETLPRYLDTHVLPDPDLVIRTSGEARISNFLLWQSAYAEYEFIDTLWPDFTAEELARLCGSYGRRDRRFGAVKT